MDNAIDDKEILNCIKKIKKCIFMKQYGISITVKDLKRYISSETIVPDVIRGVFRHNDDGKFIYDGILGLANEIPDSKHNDILLSEAEKVKNSINVKESIMMILESPHKDEYKLSKETGQTSPKLVPIAPAQGQTGNDIKRYMLHDPSEFFNQLKKNIEQKENINRNIFEIIEKITTYHKENYLFIICNPVPWQASLWHCLDDIEVSLKDNQKTKLKCLVWKKLWSCKCIQERLITNIKRHKPTLILNACTNASCPKLKSPLGAYIDEYLKKTYDDITLRIKHPSSWCFCKKQYLYKNS